MVRLSLVLVARRGAVKALAAGLRSIMTQAVGERGCVGCQLAGDLTKPDALHYVEQWSTEEDLRLRIRSGSFRQLLAVMEVAAEPPRVEIEFISRTSGLEYVEATLRQG